MSQVVPSQSVSTRPYFRRDQRDGISPPDLSKVCTYAEHIVHARGKRTQFTSISLDLAKIRDFGDTERISLTGRAARFKGSLQRCHDGRAI